MRNFRVATMQADGIITIDSEIIPVSMMSCWSHVLQPHEFMMERINRRPPC